MHKPLIKLYKQLNQMDFVSEAQDIKNLISGGKEQWQQVIAEIEKPPEAQIQDKAIQGASEMFKTGIKQFLGFAEQVKQAKKQESEDLNKQGGVGDFLLGKGGFKLGIYMAIKNIYYGVKEYQTLTAESAKLGISWLDTLRPSILSSKVMLYQNDPASMLLLAKTTRSAKLFWDEGISLVANLISSYKDFLTIIESGVGWAGIILGIIQNFALEHVIRSIETAAEHYELNQYDAVLTSIKQIAIGRIQVLEQAPQEMSSQDWISRLDEIFG